jgi:hypothetical protein
VRPLELRSLRVPGIFALALGLSACASGSGGSGAGGGSADLITQQQIDDAGVDTALDVVRRYRSRWLRPARSQNSSDVRAPTSRPGMPQKAGRGPLRRDRRTLVHPSQPGVVHPIHQRRRRDDSVWKRLRGRRHRGSHPLPSVGPRFRSEDLHASGVDPMRERCSSPTKSGIVASLVARRLMAGHRSLEPAVVVRIHPGQ